MAEAKRVTFTTISNNVTSSTIFGGNSGNNNFPSFRFGGSVFGDQTTDDGKGKDPPSVRLELELFETDSTTYPEFNYSKLMHLEKKKMKKLKQRANIGMTDPFGDKDEDMMRIVKELEDKYGTDYKSKRSHTEHSDIGKGYDESDSFIDNTEAFDEVVPEEVEPIEGGFYINCGALQFKKLHTESTTTRTDEIIKMPNRPKKRILSSSSEESSSSSDDDNDDDNEEDDEEDEEDSGEETVVEVTKEKNINKHIEKKHKQLMSSTTSTSTSTSTTTSSSASSTTSSKKSKTNGKHKKENAMTPVSNSNSSTNSPKPLSPEEIGGESDKERMQQKIVKTTTVKDMLKAKRDSFLKRKVCATTKTLNGELRGAASKSSDDETSSDDSDDDSDGKSISSDNNNDKVVEMQESHEKKIKKTLSNNDEINEKLRTSDTNLPDLEIDVITNIQMFKNLAKSMNITEKKFQFDVNLTELLLKIDESLLCIDKPQRTMVFAHLEYNLSLPKSYLLRKAKQLRIKEEKTKTQRTLLKLRKAVSSAMPTAIVNYHVELEKCTDQDVSNIDSEQASKILKKKFPWTSELRNLLFEVYQVRWTSFPVLGTRKETLEDFINEYLRTKVLDIWPKGWMRYEEIQREIEKSKIALKKSKEKLKKKDTISGKTTPTSTILNSVKQNLTTTITTSTSPPIVPISLSTATATASATISNAKNLTFQKILDDRGSRPSHTTNIDLVSGINAATILKRKADGGKQSKNKNPKFNGEMKNNIIMDDNRKQQQLNQQHQQQNSIVTPNIAYKMSTLPSSQISSSSNTTTLKTNQKHSTSAKPASMTTAPITTTHFIDLDKFNPSDILQQATKQMMNVAAATAAARNIKDTTISPATTAVPQSKATTTAAAAAATTSSTAFKNHTIIERLDSSSESDGVEIVSVFENKFSMKTTTPPNHNNNNNNHNQNYKKFVNYSSIQNSMQMNAENTSVAAAMSRYPMNMNNNNINNSNNNYIPKISKQNFEKTSVSRTTAGSSTSMKEANL